MIMYGTMWLWLGIDTRLHFMLMASLTIQLHSAILMMLPAGLGFISGQGMQMDLGMGSFSPGLSTKSGYGVQLLLKARYSKPCMKL